MTTCVAKYESSVTPGRSGSIEQSYGYAVDRIDEIAARLERPVDAPPLPPPVLLKPSSNLEPSAFEDMVTAGKRHIRAGDILQVVLSQRLSMPLEGDPFGLYRRLRTVSPSPYMYYLDLGDHQLVGASPELLIQVEGGVVSSRPIAGTRRRGRNREEDTALAKDLVEDEKERAEHLMLVDLARNDVGRVSAAGTVEVSNFMGVEQFSHVMHMVSDVTGRLGAGCSPVRRAACRVSRRHRIRGAENPRHAHHLGTRARSARLVCRGGRIHQQRRQYGNRHHNPDRLDQTWGAACSGRSGHCGRFGTGARICGIYEQGEGHAGSSGRHVMILLIDNYDSFTYNLYQVLSVLGAEVRVERNDAITVMRLCGSQPAGIVVSPGPGNPGEAGISCRLMREIGPFIPTLGVCLGHQCIAAAFGGKVVGAPVLMHGKTSQVFHTQAGVLARLPSPFQAVRYHSLDGRRAVIARVAGGDGPFGRWDDHGPASSRLPDRGGAVSP